MKKFALICMLVSLGFATVKAQNVDTTAAPANGAKIRFTEMEHNYGTISKGSNGGCEFEFFNDGNEPLVLNSVKASCGCTTPSYTQKPVMPGQRGTIKVNYNTNNVGGFSKTVTVTSNAVNSPRVVLRIKGNVKADAPSPAPQPVQPTATPRPVQQTQPIQPATTPATETNSVYAD
ncbi:MAG: DUF1573 domain-containing protein [Bacteroidales bacterium]|nr:DUF1573 domain-containing protein [Bacteroidales bacterium]